MQTQNNTVKTLSPRERNVLELISYGFSQKEAADQLHVSRATVDVHLKNIKEKTGLQKATELANAYMYKRYGLPLCDLPEFMRRRIAGALLVLSIFTAVMHTTPMLRVMRAPRSAQTNLMARSGSRTRTRETFELEIA